MFILQLVATARTPPPIFALRLILRRNLIRARFDAVAGFLCFAGMHRFFERFTTLTRSWKAGEIKTKIKSGRKERWHSVLKHRAQANRLKAENQTR